MYVLESIFGGDFFKFLSETLEIKKPDLNGLPSYSWESLFSISFCQTLVSREILWITYHAINLKNVELYPSIPSTPR